MKPVFSSVMLIVAMVILLSDGLTLADVPKQISVATMPPVVVKTVPQSGDKNVDPSIREIRVTFSKEMMDGSWSWTQISDETFPQMSGKPRYLADKRTCVLPVKLEPGRSYVTWLNSAKFGDFRDTDGRSAVPYLLVFETAGKAQDVQIPAGAVRLGYVDDSAEGKRSTGGSGHAVRFDRPAEADHVVAVQIYGSRYGRAQPPVEDFHVYLLDQDQKLIHDLPVPYAKIERGPERWYTLKMPAVKVPEQFYVALSFNPHQTKGIYVGVDQGITESHSYVGLPASGFTEVDGKYDWMVRAYLIADPFEEPQDKPTQTDQDRLRRWVITGQVTDEQGRGMQDVTVRASCGMGTLMPTGSTATDADGRYTLRFGPGMRQSGDADGQVPVGLQAATISVWREGYTEKNLHRQGDLRMANRMPEEDNAWNAKPEQIVLPDKPVQLDFVLVPAASVAVELLDAEETPMPQRDLWLKGKQLPPSCSVLRGGKTDQDGCFHFEDVPQQYAWWFVARKPQGGDGRTLPFTLPQAGSYRVKLRWGRDSQTGMDLLRIVSFADAEGRDLRDQLVGDDPFARPPVGPQLQAKGWEVLKKMAAANRYWLGLPPPEVRSYEYDFQFAGASPTRYTEPHGSAAAGPVRQGISYYGVLHRLAGLPEDTVFRLVEIGDEQIKLVYTVKTPVRMSAGNGIQGSYRGYFSTSIGEGMLIIDAKTYTPREHTASRLHETFSQYVEIADGLRVPLRIRIEQGGTVMDWQFRVYQPGLWLFDASYRQGSAEERELVASIDHVKVNGEEAKTLHRVQKEEPQETSDDAADSTDGTVRVDHVVVRRSAVGEDYARAIARITAAARTIAINKFGLDIPETITVDVSKRADERARLFTDGQDQVFLTVPSEESLCRPSASNIHHVYGLCHEVGHMAMYRAIRDPSWMTTAAAEGWAHYLGSRIVDDIYAQHGKDLWPDPHDYVEDGTQRLEKQLASATVSPVAEGVGLWQEMVGIVGDQGVAPIFAAWGKATLDPADPQKALGKLLPARSGDDRLAAWWKKAADTFVRKREQSGFVARTVGRDQILGQSEELAQDDGRSAGKRSYAGGGHAVRFKAPADSRLLTAVRIYGSRYGSAGPPKEDFHVWLCDKQFKPIADSPFPYATFQRGEPKWVTLPVEPTEVPEEFIVGVGFNPTATKGVYVHHDGGGSGKSLVGLPGGDAKPFAQGDWMIRATVDQLKSK